LFALITGVRRRRRRRSEGAWPAGWTTIGWPLMIPSGKDDRKKTIVNNCGNVRFSLFMMIEAVRFF
jgi:hypothetical protein